MLFGFAAAAFCQNHLPDPGRLIAFKKQNAALLTDIPNYTCLESMGQSVITPIGRSIDIDLLRVDVAILGRKEL